MKNFFKKKEDYNFSRKSSKKKITEKINKNMKNL
jgi:hypothetical protein